MLNDRQHNLIDGLSRELVAEYVRNSRHKDDEKLLKYVYEDMSYEDVILAAWCRELVLTEEDTSSDIKRELRIKTLEKELGGMLSLPLSFLVGGIGRKGIAATVTRRAIAKGMAPGLAAKAGVAASAGMLGIAGSIGASMAISFGIGLLSKVIFAMIQKKFSGCRKRCDSSIPGNDVLKKQKVRVCYHKCRIQQLQRLMPMLKKERRNCSKTDRPDRCMKGLYDQEVKYTDMLKTEQGKLLRAQENYKRSDMKLKKKMSKISGISHIDNISRTT